MEQIVSKLMANVLSGEGNADRCLAILGWRGPSFAFVLKEEILSMGPDTQQMFVNKIHSQELIGLESFGNYIQCYPFT